LLRILRTRRALLKRKEQLFMHGKSHLGPLAKALLLTTILCGSAQAVIGQNSAKATLLAGTDLEGGWTLEGETKGVLDLDNNVRAGGKTTGDTEQFAMMAGVKHSNIPMFAMPLFAIQAASDGSWKDNATGLIWAIKDNGSDVNWNLARDYCGNLRVGGFSDWSLPTIDELEALYDEKLSKQFKARGPIELGGSCSLSETKNNSGEVWSYCFSYGGRSLGPISGHGSAGRALCVRRPGK
jgi:hypothetical protein